MKVKTIEKILNNKFNAFVKTIKDDNVKKLVKANTIITGGCIASLLLNENVNDYDLYFVNKETCIAVTNYYVAKFVKNQSESSKPKIIVEDIDDRISIKVVSEGIVSYVQDSKNKTGFTPMFITGNAITLSNDVQLIVRFYGEAEEIHKNFDFIHATNYWVSYDRKVYTNHDALESLITKELKIKDGGTLYPIASLFRLRKFIKRGFYINAGEMLKIIYQCNQLNLQDIEVLKEQLLGVDIVYFQELIADLKQGGVIDYNYICKLVDEIF